METINTLCSKTSKKIKNIDEEKVIDIRQEAVKSGPIMFDMEDDDSIDELSDYEDDDEEEEDDGKDFAELLL